MTHHKIEFECNEGQMLVDLNTELYRIDFRYGGATELEAVLISLNGLDIGPDDLRAMGSLFERLANIVEQDTEVVSYLDDEDDEA